MVNFCKAVIYWVVLVRFPPKCCPLGDLWTPIRPQSACLQIGDDGNCSSTFGGQLFLLHYIKEPIVGLDLCREQTAIYKRWTLSEVTLREFPARLPSLAPGLRYFKKRLTSCVWINVYSKSYYLSHSGAVNAVSIYRWLMQNLCIASAFPN